VRRFLSQPSAGGLGALSLTLVSGALAALGIPTWTWGVVLFVGALLGLWSIYAAGVSHGATARAAPGRAPTRESSVEPAEFGRYLDSINRTMEEHGFGRNPNLPPRPSAQVAGGPLKPRALLLVSTGRDLAERMAGASNALEREVAMREAEQWHRSAYELLSRGDVGEGVLARYVDEQPVIIPRPQEWLLSLTGSSPELLRARIVLEQRVARLRQIAEDL
jgi:hypothetical protein